MQLKLLKITDKVEIIDILRLEDTLEIINITHLCYKWRGYCINSSLFTYLITQAAL